MSTGTMLYNPFTGEPRAAADIASDPEGHLLWDGKTPLRVAEPTVRYCYECGRIGEVDYTKHRDCCPDGSHARYVHPKIAEQAQCGTGGYVAQLSERVTATGRAALQANIPILTDRVPACVNCNGTGDAVAILGDGSVEVTGLCETCNGSGVIAK